MGREVPFSDDLPCDHCGAAGAFDFMGDAFCSVCIAAFQRDEDLTVSESTDASKSHGPTPTLPPLHKSCETR